MNFGTSALKGSLVFFTYQLLAVAMPIAAHFNDPRHWYQRAEESRVLAEQMIDETAKGMTLKIAEDYDELAERASVRLIGTPRAAMWEAP